MKKSILSLFCLSAALLLPLTLHAQGGSVDGCGSSPENPTIVLALVGSAGAAAASIRSRIRARRNVK